MNVGDILVSSWGYDQTNIDFYQVVKRTAKTVTVQAINQQMESEGPMHGTCAPLKNQFLEDSRIDHEREQHRRKIKGSDTDPYIMIRSFAAATPWAGGRMNWSSWA